MSSFVCTLSAPALAQYATRQMNALTPDDDLVNADDLAQLMPSTLQRLEHCFSKINNRYFFDGTHTIFNHLHSDQYAMFLYIVAHTAAKTRGGTVLASKLFLLNKALHGVDIYFEVELPAVFLLVHPLGTVLGRGRYSDFLLVYQRCGVGSNHDVYPELGEFVTLRPGSSVLGSSRLGRNVTVATESLVLDNDVPDDTVYIGNPRDFIMRATERPPAIWRL